MGQHVAGNDAGKTLEVLLALLCSPHILSSESSRSENDRHVHRDLTVSSSANPVRYSDTIIRSLDLEMTEVKANGEPVSSTQADSGVDRNICEVGIAWIDLYDVRNSDTIIMSLDLEMIEVKANGDPVPLKQAGSGVDRNICEIGRIQIVSCFVGQVSSFPVPIYR